MIKILLVEFLIVIYWFALSVFLPKGVAVNWLKTWFASARDSYES